MALECITNINVDFYDRQYILLNSKQLDKNTRFLSVTCYNQGELYSLDNINHAAYIRYKKADGYSVFNFCTIKDGKILVELTEQMLATSGICTADLVVVNRGQASVDAETGKIVNLDKASVMSTMTFHIDVAETAVDNADIESSYEYNAFNQSLETYWSNFEAVMQTAKSYAVGNAGGIRENEDTDNAKYYAEIAASKMIEATNSASSAATSADAAATSAANAKTSENNASNYKDNARTYMNQAQSYRDEAISNASASAESAASADSSANSAISSAVSATESASNAAESAETSETYMRQTEAIVNGLNGAFLPMGTITFSELAALKDGGTVAVGYLYNISDNFTTDDTFKGGGGVEYDAGANVYYTADGYWDVLSGATVTGVKGVNETVYRKGNVELTAENVGAVATTNVATVDEVKNYLGIA